MPARETGAPAEPWATRARSSSSSPANGQQQLVLHTRRREAVDEPREAGRPRIVVDAVTDGPRGSSLTTVDFGRRIATLLRRQEPLGRSIRTPSQGATQIRSSGARIRTRSRTHSKGIGAVRRICGCSTMTSAASARFVRCHLPLLGTVTKRPEFAASAPSVLLQRPIVPSVRADAAIARTMAAATPSPTRETGARRLGFVASPVVGLLPGHPTGRLLVPSPRPRCLRDIGT